MNNSNIESENKLTMISITADRCSFSLGFDEWDLSADHIDKKTTGIASWLPVVIINV